MKILLLHPDDSLEVGAWAGTRWSSATDLGWAGRNAYAQLSERLGFPVSSIYDLPDHGEFRDLLREILSLGLDQLVDAESVDWWDTFSSYPFAQLEQLLRLSALAGRIPAQAEVFATRPHFMLRALSLLLNREIKSFAGDRSVADRQPGIRMRFHRYLKAAFALRPSQLAEIAFDKWDPDYRLRRHFARPPKTSSTPAILLPSAYVNVSRVQVACVRMLPHRRFLLVATRSSGALRELPGNVELLSLASYATPSLHSTDEERIRLLARWQELQHDLFETNPVLRLAGKLNVFGGFADFLKHGLRVRDAWREVFAREPITTVLSADEFNPYTRLPVLLARSRKLRTVFCDHGALSCSFGFRRPVSNTYLVQGDMARDYDIEWCGLGPDKIVVGSPFAANSQSLSRDQKEKVRREKDRKEKDWIVFYSEAYELSSGHTQGFYAELLPELCLLARQTNRRVIVKLHPFESLRMRKAMIDRALSAEQRSLIEMREGPMTPDLFERAWFSVTVESSVAVESTANGVPCFLCGWFDSSWYDYAPQYAKFSAGYLLDSPQSIRQIPHLLDGIKVTDATRAALQTSISSEHLDSILSGK